MAKRIEVLCDLALDVFERFINAMMPSLGIGELRRLRALDDFDRRLVDFSQAPAGYGEAPAKHSEIPQ